MFHILLELRASNSKFSKQPVSVHTTSDGYIVFLSSLSSTNFPQKDKFCIINKQWTSF
jgi:hypothetical protein